MELKILNVKKKYKRKIAVNNVSLTLKPGITALLGANGSGKTTLMRIITTVLKPDAGSVFFNGSDMLKTVTISEQCSAIFLRISAITENSPQMIL